MARLPHSGTCSAQQRITQAGGQTGKASELARGKGSRSSPPCRILHQTHPSLKTKKGAAVRSRPAVGFAPGLHALAHDRAAVRSRPALGFDPGSLRSLTTAPPCARVRRSASTRAACARSRPRRRALASGARLRPGQPALAHDRVAVRSRPALGFDPGSLRSLTTAPPCARVRRSASTRAGMRSLATAPPCARVRRSKKKHGAGACSLVARGQIVFFVWRNE
jgi:hypothetical protein